MGKTAFSIEGVGELPNEPHFYTATNCNVENMNCVFQSELTQLDKEDPPLVLSRLQVPGDYRYVSANCIAIVWGIFYNDKDCFSAQHKHIRGCFRAYSGQLLPM